MRVFLTGIALAVLLQVCIGQSVSGAYYYGTAGQIPLLRVDTMITIKPAIGSDFQDWSEITSRFPEFADRAPLVGALGYLAFFCVPGTDIDALFAQVEEDPAIAAVEPVYEVSGEIAIPCNQLVLRFADTVAVTVQDSVMSEYGIAASSVSGNNMIVAQVQAPYRDASLLIANSL